MAKKTKEPVVEENKETTQPTIEQVKETPQVDKTKFESAGDDSIIKVDLSQPPISQEDKVENEVVTEDKVEEAVTEVTDNTETQPEVEVQETPILEEITEEETAEVEEMATKAEEAIKENLETGEPLPENIQKLMDFMEDTGGDLNDYVKLNQDYSNIKDSSLLYEYYNQTKSHLEKDEIDFLIEDNFSFDDEIDEPRDIKRKKLAYKEEIAKAKSYLEGLKDKYYKEVKLGSKLTGDQQEEVNVSDVKDDKEKEAMDDVELSDKTSLENNPLV
jgi:hypothetical protein